MKSLKNKVAMVTGASEGIGRGIAGALAKQGVKVAIVARSQEKLEETARELQGDVFPFAADLMDAEAVRAVAQKIAEQLGPIDILINNVGGGTFKPLDMQSAWEADLPVHLPMAAAVAACHSVIPSMIERKSGHLINLTSPAGYVPFPYMMPYVAARHAMVGLSLSLYEELKEHGIGSTLFCPSKVNTGYFDRNDADMGWYPKISSIFPTITPEDIGEQVVKAIRGNKREVIYPFTLWAFLRFYQKMPGLSVACLKLLNLWKPTATRKGK